jgi:predicted aconitase
LDALRQALVDRTLEVTLHAASKAAAGAAFAKIAPDRPPSPDARARKAAADKRKAAAAGAAAARATPLAKPTDPTKPPSKK